MHHSNETKKYLKQKGSKQSVELNVILNKKNWIQNKILATK